MKIVITLIFISLFIQQLFATDLDSLDLYNQIYTVDTIIISGNNLTDDDIILRELTFKIGDLVNYKTLIYNSERIYSLGLFTSVKVFSEKVNRLDAIIILVEESWYIWPIPLLEINDKKDNKLSYGFDLLIRNFRGRNEEIRGRMLLGFDPRFSVSYYNPWLIHKENISLLLEASYQKMKNKSIFARDIYGGDFEQSFSAANIVVGKRLDLFQTIRLRTAYYYIESPIYIPGISVSNERIDRVLAVGSSYTYDTRDLAQFPKEGIFLNADLLFKGLTINGINYRIFSLDYRQYEKIYEELITKWRTSIRLSGGKSIPYYDYSYLGYGQRVRGHTYREREGHHLLISGIELAYPLVKDWQISFDLPIIPKELLSYRVALYLQLFGDTGATFYRKNKFSFNQFDTGFGLGFTLLVLPYNLIRVEYAFNEKFIGELILDVGISF